MGTKRRLRRLKTRTRFWLRKRLPGSSRGSRYRNLLSILCFCLSLVWIGILWLEAADGFEFKVASILGCALAFLYFYEVIIAAIFLISHRFQISPLRLIRDVMLSAFYTICSFGFHFSQFGLNGPDEEVPGWFDYLYFSAVTFSTLGYGDFSPTADSRPLAALEALYGNIHLGLLAGSIFLMIEQFSKRKT